MRVGLLGTLAIRIGDQDVHLPGAKQRALVARLALDAGRAVSADRLIELLWGDDLPGDANNALQARVSQVRKAIGKEGLTSGAGGYVLHVEPGDVDAHAFEGLARQGAQALAAGSASQAAELLREALALWRGEALADVGDHEDLVAEARRLSDLRLGVVEDRVEADLALGRHLELCEELAPVVDRNPLRERLRGHLVLALYRSGRQADALAVLSAGREVLAEELGLEPGPDLQALELAILRHDPAIGAPARPAAAPIASARLPRPRSTFVGRTAELEEVAALLDEERLVTLTGPGGSGKTRLALELASARQDVRSDEVWLVELAGLRDPAAVPGAIAGPITTRDRAIEDASSDPLDRVAAYLGPRPALLVLDNCEHVIDTAARAVQRLLDDSPGLRVLATSREALDVPGEVIRAVEPLPLDEAVSLFLDRARPATGGVDGAAERGSIASICEHLDGLPLAVELAAARVRLLPVDAIATRLADRFRFLSGGSRTALPRQQTLQALVDWSYELLFEDEQRLFTLASAFAGPFALEDVEALAGRSGIDPVDVVDLLGRLVDKSLVQLLPDPTGDARFRMLETLREYGRQRLAETGALDAALAAHAEVYADLATHAAPHLFDGTQLMWLARLDGVHDNLAAAGEWAVAHDRSDLALQLASSLTWFWFLRGRWREGASTVAGALAMEGAPAPLRARTLAWQCHWSHEVDVDLDRALATATEAVGLARSTGDDHLLALCEVQLARTEFQLGRRSAVRATAERLLPVFEAAGDRFWAGICRYFETVSWLFDGELDHAADVGRTCLADMEATGERWGMLVALIAQAGVDEAAGRLADAVPRYQRALRHATELDFELAKAHVRVRLAAVLGQLGDAAQAEPVCVECLEFGRRVADAHLIGFSALALGRLRRRTPDLEAAVALAQEALTNLTALGSPFRRAALHELAWCAEEAGDLAGAQRLHLEALGDDDLAVAGVVEGLAGAACAGGDPALAAELLGAAAAVRDRVGAAPPDAAYDIARISDRARRELGDGAYDRAVGRGGRLSPAEALELGRR